MKAKKVVTMKHGEARIVSTELWMEYRRRKVAEQAKAEARGGGGPCEDVCEDHGGVLECGESYADCHDGTSWLLNP